MKIEFVGAPSPSAVVAVLVNEGRELSAPAQAYDQRSGGALTRAVAGGRFTGGKASSLALVAPHGLEAPQLVAVGAGAKDKFDDLALEGAAGHAYHSVKLSGHDTLALDLSDRSAADAARAAFAIRLAAYRFDKYRTTEKPERKPSIATVQIVTADPAAAQAAFAPLAAIAEGVLFARDLVSEVPNVLYPAEFARRCKALEPLGLQVEVLGEAEMTKLGMNTLLAVGQGSAKESQLVVMRWNGAADKDAQPIAFVGKGVTFDTGGISIKPAEGMEEMKFDMGGAAAVAGLMHALAGRKAKVNAVGVLGLVENMPDGDAQRPGDVVKSMSGQTVEIINTDAEGRLVLADALWYTQERFKPKFMVDLATLTGAMIISLGLDYAGIFANDDDLAAALAAGSAEVGENTWRLPLPAQYEKQIESACADMKNTGGRPAGSITAALFLQKFTNGVPWAHIDIAPTAWKKDSKVATVPDGASGFGVRLLDRMVAAKYEG
ncbi:leucyl aminopeptidase [Caulobacter sp. 17J80-11]|uniref:leucyl aminopeptidase n=1 Tax=Caulobacter sp. 17J80-11 TaxID=2763502 RepID=UPI001653624E|nr:leucyl aminopeptidase [Caulobacter sp. 17J80-11]MBC6983028.1 leucyl aminopeptidase [Caulobacter sp. 17J80-11]